MVDVAVERIYKGERKVSWMEIYTGEKSIQVYGQNVWLPAEIPGLIREYRVAIKGPLTTPIGGGIRSLNVALRQELGLHICLRPVHYYQGTSDPAKHPGLIDMVISRESSKDIYAGIEWKAGPAGTEEVIKFLCEEMGVKRIRFPEHCGIGIGLCSEKGTKYLIRAAIEYAIANDRNSVTLVYESNIMKFAEEASKNWGYQLVREEFGGELIDGDPQPKVKNPNIGKETVIKGVIVDTFLQQILLRPAEYDVIVCMNLNGDYISNVLTTQTDGIGITPGVNVGDECAPFEVTHGTAPRYTGQDKVNPGPTILSTEMMLHHTGRTEVADLTVKGMEGVINTKIVTYDFERLMEGVKLLKCPKFGDTIIEDI